jgi:hypothetical protein
MTREGAITETTLLAATDAGMHALWNPARFTGITDYPTWENALLEDDDVTRRVQAPGRRPHPAARPPHAQIQELASSPLAAGRVLSPTRRSRWVSSSGSP